MNLARSNRDWDHLGRHDPMWAILSHPARRGRRWDADSFFATGAEEIGQAVVWADQLVPSLRRGQALDFGCGIGRLTLPLAGIFKELVGVDGASSMIEQARQNAAARGVTNCRFVLNTEGDLRIFPDDAFDFIYSRIVLQHIPAPASTTFLSEFVRVLRPGGLAIFQVPSDPVPAPRRLRDSAPSVVPKAWRGLKRLLTLEGRVGMYGIPSETVAELVEGAGGSILARKDDDESPGWVSYWYAVVANEREPR